MAALGAAALAGGVVWFIGALYSLARTVMGGALTLELTVLDPRVDGDLPAGLNSIAWDGAQVNITLEALGPAISTVLLGSRAISVIVGAIVTGAIGIVLLRLARRAPFHRSLFAVAIVAGAALSFGSMIALGSHVFGSLMASDRVNGLLGGEVFAIDATVDPLPVFLGLVVMAMAVVFRSGERLQRDTEGLV
jgi:hypothetical protein